MGSKPKADQPVVFHVPNTTMNVMPSATNNILRSLSEGETGKLLAGARANVGVKAGRYMFEVKVIELIESWKDRRSELKIGLSTEGSSLFLGSDEESVCFDLNGRCWHNNKSTNVCDLNVNFTRDSVIAVLI